MWQEVIVHKSHEAITVCWNFIPFWYVLEDPIAKRLSASPRNISERKDVHIAYDQPPVQVRSEKMSFDAFYFFHSSVLRNSCYFNIYHPVPPDNARLNHCSENPVVSVWYYTFFILLVYTDVVTHIINQFYTQHFNTQLLEKVICIPNLVPIRAFRS